MENILDIKVNQPKPVKSPKQLRDEYAELIELYKASNPVKYARKEPALKAKLAKLEAACGKKEKPEELEESEEPKVVSARKPRIKK